MATKRKTSSKKGARAAKKAPARRSAARKAPAKKGPKRGAARRAAPMKAAPKKAAPKKAAARKATAAKKPAPRAAAKPAAKPVAKPVAKPAAKPAATPAAKPVAKAAAHQGAPGGSKFVWHDLMTTNLDSSKAFYTGLFGWQLKPWDMGAMGTYWMFGPGEDSFGGFMPFDKSHGWPAHWMPYISVADVDAACELVKKLGGSVANPPADIPQVGRFAVVSDPAGGTFSPFKPLSEMPPTKGPPAVLWNELRVPDPAAVAPFYEKLLGWKTESMDMGPMGTYHVFKGGEPDPGGLCAMPPSDSGRPYWLTYFGVDDVDAKVRDAEARGAKVIEPATDVPTVGRMATLVDPDGAKFAVFKPAPRS